MKISFIIPIYNVSSYLHQCVDSVLAQTFRQFEIILVDDGSTDDSGQICDAYKERDDRVKVIHKENGGLSDARNVGAQHATGDYLIFLDGDDFWMNEDDLERIVEIIKESPDCDFIGFNYKNYYAGNNLYLEGIPYPSSTLSDIDNEHAIGALVGSGIFPMSACFKVIKRVFLVENALFFEKGLTAEDIPWFINVLEKTKSTRFVNQYIYAYRQDVQSSITKSFTSVKFDNLLHIVEREISMMEHRNFSKAAKEALFSFLAYELCILLAYLKELSPAERAARWNKLLSYKWLFNYTQHPKVKWVNRVRRLVGMRVVMDLLHWYLLRNYLRK